MNILYITQSNPLNMSNGSYQRTNHLWNALKKCGVVYTSFIIGPQDKQVIDNENKIKSFIIAPKTWLGRHIWAFFNKIVSPAVSPFQSLSYVKKQIPWKNVHFDCVVVRYLYIVNFTKAWEFGKCYVDIDDLPSESFDTITKKHYVSIIGIILSKYVKLWQNYILKKCEGAWIANPKQVVYVNKYCNCQPLLNIAKPPSNNYQLYKKQKKQVMTVGLMSYEPNYIGVDHFINEIWTEVNKKYPNIDYMVAGRGLSQDLKKKWGKFPGVHILGYVNNLESLYEQSLAIITPILSGSGTCIKVQEACLYGRKVFATRFAVRGFTKEEITKLRIEIFENKEDFIKKFSIWYEATINNVKEEEEIFNNAKNIINVNKFEESVKSIISD